MINVSVQIPKELPVQQLDSYMDKVVHNVARITLDYTNSKQRFPYLSGELNRASMAEGVVSDGNKTYHLGARGVSYAPAVWKFSQKGTRWTNPNTFAQWYITEFKNEKELIVSQAVNNAIRSFK